MVSTTWFRRFEWIANSVSVLAAVAIIGVLAKQYVSNDGVTKAEALPTGKAIQLRNVNWSDSDRTIVLVLSTTCRYCAASAPFYRELLGASVSDHVRIIAVFPETPAEAGAYLRIHKLDKAEIRQSTLGDIGVNGTPAVLLVARDGRVRQGWIGALSATQEAQVFTSLHLARSPASRTISESGTAPSSTGPDHNASSDELGQMTAEYGPQPIVDIRERTPFGAGHIEGALNIPLAELEVRAAHEVPRNRPVFLYCRYSSLCETTATGDGLLTHCALAKYLLEHAGVTQVRTLVGNLTELQSRGIKVSGSTHEQ